MSEEVATWTAQMRVVSSKLKEAEAVVAEKQLEKDRLEKIQKRMQELTVLQAEVLWAELRAQQAKTVTQREALAKQRETSAKVQLTAERAKAKTAELDREVADAQWVAGACAHARVRACVRGPSTPCRDCFIVRREEAAEAEKELDVAKAKAEELGELVSAATEAHASARATESGARKAADDMDRRLAGLDRSIKQAEARLASNDSTVKRAARLRGIADAKAAKERAEADEVAAKRERVRDGAPRPRVPRCAGAPVRRPPPSLSPPAGGGGGRP